MSLIRFPGLIDIHVHLREPGAIHKEDFATGSRAAVAGGFTFIIDMPNNPVPTVSIKRLEDKICLASQKAVCGIGFHYGTDGKNLDSFPKAGNNPKVYGLKVYCNHTTGTLLIEDEIILDKVFAAWKCKKPILVHAEGEKAELCVFLAQKYGRRLHICHISRSEELAIVERAKKRKLPVTCGTTPHYLFLSTEDAAKPGSFALMKPPLGSKASQQLLWDGIGDGIIDIVESDHAPHTKEEKESTNPPFGVPGLETTLGLLLKSVRDKKLTIEQIKNLLYDHPKQIFPIRDQENTYIEFNPDEPYQIGLNGYETKCNWSPFDGWEAYGKVKNALIYGKPVLKNSKFV